MLQRTIRKARMEWEEMAYHRIAARYDIRGYRRLYLVHIRKTGGTSLNRAFLALSGEDAKELYSRLVKAPSHRVQSGNKVYVGWNAQHINRGNFFYAFSHVPLHRLNLPKGTFTLTCFRDPVKRVVSHYNMLMNYRINQVDHPCMATEGPWLGESFTDFLERIPREHLLRQLYMFSERFEVNEALDAIGRLSHCFFTEHFDEGVTELKQKTGLCVEPLHVARTGYHSDIPAPRLARLRELLDREYLLLDQVRKQIDKRSAGDSLSRSYI